MSKFKVGDRVRDTTDHWKICGLKGPSEGTIEKWEDGSWTIKWDDPDYGRVNWHDYQIELVNASPVRRIEKVEIVPGTYGRVVVSPYAESSATHVGLTMSPIIGHGYAALSAKELRAAAATFIALAEALEQ